MERSDLPFFLLESLSESLRKRMAFSYPISYLPQVMGNFFAPKTTKLLTISSG
jgi:hypothetical protein